jgi:branched-chain amino acid transport system ATP-binding protein
MSYFVVENVSLRFGGLHAVRNLSFAVEQGEVFAIIGPNGAGKTSVFNILTRVFAPSGGRVVFNGVDITALPRHKVAGAGIARTFQNIALFEQETVLNNLLLGRHRWRNGGFVSQLCRAPLVAAAEEQARAEVEEIIELLELARYRQSLVAGLPYGVRKVVELARALASKPELLLLDEPASGLNDHETRDLAYWIEEIRDNYGVTIIMIEHDMSLVAAIAGRVLCMNMGEQLALGSPAHVQADPAVIAAYLGT